MRAGSGSVRWIMDGITWKRSQLWLTFVRGLIGWRVVIATGIGSWWNHVLFAGWFDEHHQRSGHPSRSW
jgi:hypothetical protein